MTCLKSLCDSVVEAELEFEADSQHLPIPNGNKSFLIKSNVGQLSHHLFSNISGLFPVSVFSLELQCVHNKCVKILKHRVGRNLHFALWLAYLK